MTPFAAVVLDMDGVLLNTHASWTRAERAVLARYGRDFDLEAERELLGLSLRDAGAALGRLVDQDRDSPALTSELYDALLADVGANARPMKGAVKLISSIDGQLSTALASNAPRAVVDAALRTAGITSPFGAYVSADDVERPKPAPDIYRRACEMLGVEASKAVAVEDSPAGVAAARAAGLTVIGVTSTPGVRLEADVVVETLEDDAIWLTLRLSPP